MADKPLSKKHLAFIDEYLRTFNATQAYLRVYPESSYDAARRDASRLLTNADIKAEITARLQEAHMGADEALKLMSEIARGDMAHVMDVTSVGFNLDMDKAQQLGVTKLIKKVKQKTTTFIAKKESDEDREVTELEVELYSALEAQRDILKIHGKFVNKVDITSQGEKIKGYVGISPDDWKKQDDSA